MDYKESETRDTHVHIIETSDENKKPLLKVHKELKLSLPPEKRREKRQTWFFLWESYFFKKFSRKCLHISFSESRQSLYTRKWTEVGDDVPSCSGLVSAMLDWRGLRPGRELPSPMMGCRTLGEAVLGKEIKRFIQIDCTTVNKYANTIS